MNILSVGNVYRGLDQNDERLASALRGANVIIERSRQPLVPPAGLSEQTRAKWKTADEILRATSARVQKHRTSLGTARYIRWGGIACDWNELVADMRSGKADVVMATQKAEDLTTVARACNAEMDKVLQVPGTTVAGEAAPAKAGMSTTMKVLAGGGIAAGIFFVFRYFWGSNE